VKAKLRRHLGLTLSGLCAASAAVQALRGHPSCANRRGLLATATFLAPTLIPNCPWNGPVFQRLPTSKREVWLTIDDGPDPHDTPEILDVLARNAAHASFFAIGHKVWRYPEAARAVVAAGHEMHNHTWSHPADLFWAASPRCARREIAAANDAIGQVTAQPPRFFRAPAGLANPFVHAATAEAGLRIVGWSARGYDGVPHEPDVVVDRIVRRLRPGAVILLHEGPVAGLRPGTRARTLECLLGKLSTLGYRTALPPV